MIKNIFETKIVTKEIVYDYKDDVNDKNAEFQKNEVGKNPLIEIHDSSLTGKGVQIEPSNIKTLILKNTKTYPEIEIKFSDPTSVLIMDKYPTDDTIISLYKKSTSKGWKDIKMDFRVTKISFINGDGNSKNQIEVVMHGILKIDELYLYNFESYKGTSVSTIKTLSENMKLGFSSNVEDSNDDMVWINTGDMRQNFIKDIISHSYVNDTTFMFGYVDFYYNFNYVDINKAINDDISKQDNIQDTEMIDEEAAGKTEPLIFSNNEDNASNNLFIDKYTIFQNSTEINLEHGYRNRFRDYDTKDDKINIELIDALSETTENGIILKGNPYKEDLLYKESINGEYLGKRYNVYDNYLKSETLNKQNLAFLQKLKIVIKLKKQNYGIYRFQKVLLELYNYGKMKGDEVKEKHEYDNNLIHALSGEWIITGIKFNYITKDRKVAGKKSENIQEITLVKRELTEEYNFPRRTDEKK